MTKSEIKNQIVEVFNSINVNTLTQNQSTWYPAIKGWVGNINNSNITKQNLVDLLENMNEMFVK